MTWEMLAKLLSEAAPTAHEWAAPPASHLSWLEERAAANPAERHWDRLLLATQDACRASEEPIPAGCTWVLSDLIRWDGLTTTRAGHDPASGKRVLVRQLRTSRRADPLALRLFRRQTESLLTRVPDLVRRDDWCGAPLPGSPLAEERAATGGLLARLLGTGLAELTRWQAGGCSPLHTPVQWCETERGLVLVCLEEGPRGDMAEDIAWLARALGGAESSDEPVEELRAALVLAPPAAPMEAEEALLAAMATQLAGERHALFLRDRDLRASNRLAALARALERLAEAMPPVEGIGAVGVDMEGQVLAVHSNSDAVLWGPPGALEPLWTAHTGFAPPVARQFLRARARSPSNPRLHREVGGQAEVTQAVGRWVAAGLKLRTLRILVRHQLGTPSSPPSAR